MTMQEDHPMKDMKDVARELIEERPIRADTINVLAEFFKDSFADDPMGVSDWLAQNGTSVDLFVELVAALRSPQVTEGAHQDD